MANTNEGTVALNNYLQQTGQITLLSWDDQQTGPRHAAQWTSHCKVNGVTVATGTGPRRNLARDAAATAALEVLKAQEEA